MAVNPCAPCSDPCVLAQSVMNEFSYRQAVLATLCGILGALGGSQAAPTDPVFGTLASGQTADDIVPLVANKKIVVTGVFLLAGTVATAVTLQSYDGATHTPIGPAIPNGIEGGEVLPYNYGGWAKTESGQGLSITNGTGSTTTYIITWRLE